MLPVRDIRQRVIELLDRRESRGVGSVCQRVAIGRNAAAEQVRRYRFLRTKRRRRLLCELHWHVPGAVWAIDGTWLPWPVEGAGRQALVIVELGRGNVIACQPIAGERADAILAFLEDAVRRFGAPLVIKWDNGSGFVAEQVQTWCEYHGIARLHSPPRRPSYNGGCEVRNRWAKDRIVRAALAAGRDGILLREDLAAACQALPSMPALPLALRPRFREALRCERQALAEERGLALGHAIDNPMRRSLERVAVRRALIRCHILTIQRP